MAYNKIATRYTYYTISKTSTPNSNGDLRAFGTAYYEQTENDKALKQSKVKLEAGIYATNVTGTVYGSFTLNANIYKNVNGSWVQIGTGSYNASGMTMSSGSRTLITISDKIVPHDSNGDGTFRVAVSISNIVFTVLGVQIHGTNQSYSYTYSLPKIEEQAYITNVTTSETNQTLLNYGITGNTYVNLLSSKQYSISLYNPTTMAIDTYEIINGTLSSKNNYATSFTSTVNLDFNNKEIYTEDIDEQKRPSMLAKVNFSNSGYVYSYIDYDTNTFIDYFVPQFIPTSTTTKRNGQLSGKVTLNASGTYFNGNIGTLNQGGTYKPTIKYKLWKTSESEPSNYDYTIPASSISINNGTFSVSNYEIGNDDPTATNYFDFNSAYHVKLQVNDTFKSSTTTTDVIQGVAIWTEYKDRVDFKKITTNKLVANNIQSGTASITNVNAGTTITFNTPFDTVPNVVLTPITTTSGAVSIKIIEITTTYFKAYNSTSQSVNACWIAMN